MDKRILAAILIAIVGYLGVFIFNNLNAWLGIGVVCGGIYLIIKNLLK